MQALKVTLSFICILATSLGQVIPPPVDCFPRMGDPNYGFMPNYKMVPINPYNLSEGYMPYPAMGWWYIDCNAALDSVDGNKRVAFHLVGFETFIPGETSMEYTATHASLSLPDARPDKDIGFYSGVKQSIALLYLEPVLWGALPINLHVNDEVGDSYLLGDADRLTGYFEGEDFKLSFSAGMGEGSFRMMHGNGTGCMCTEVPFNDDQFIASTVRMHLDDSSYVEMKDPKDRTISKKIFGTCHFFRQHNVIRYGVYQWIWGQASFGDVPDSPLLSNADVMWYGAYDDANATNLIDVHVGIKTPGGPLLEWDGLSQVDLVQIERIYSTESPTTSFAHKVSVIIASANVSFVVSGLVAEAIIVVPGFLGPGDNAYHETPAEYFLDDDEDVVVGVGFLEVTTGIWNAA